MCRRLCALAWLILVAQTARAERLPIKAYTTADGLAHVRVTCITSDSRGFLWFGSPEGLSRFDGQGFTTYGVPEGLGNPRVTDFLESSRGTYWVATNGGGVFRFRPLEYGPAAQPAASEHDGIRAPRFTAFGVGDGPQTNRINALHEDRSGRLWAGTDGGLFYLDERNGDATFRRLTLGFPASPDPALQIWAFAEDRHGSLWIGTSAGLFRRLPGGGVVHSDVQPMNGVDHVRALLIDRQDRVWIGHDAGLIVFHPGDDGQSVPAVIGTSDHAPTLRGVSLPSARGEAVRYTTGDGVSGGYVRSLLRSADGRIWIATRDGLTQFDGRRFRAFTRAQGITRATALAEDRVGNIWVGTLAIGAVRVARDGFSAFTEPDGLADTLIGGVFESVSGDLYAVSSTQRIHRFDGTRFRAVRPNLSHDLADPAGPGRALQDRTGEWWIPGGAGLYRFPKVTDAEQLARVRPKAIYTTRDGLAGNDVFRLFEDSRGDIWIGRRIPTSLVLTRWERSTGTFHRYSESDGLPAFSRIYAFAEDHSGSLWIGFQNGGLARFRNGRFTLFTRADGAPNGGIGGLYVDTCGRLWIGSQDPALSRVDDPAAEQPRFAHYSDGAGLSGTSVGPITEDRWGRLYLGSTSGRIDRLDPASGRVRRYTSSDGLAGTDLTAALRDRHGHIWFGTYDGLFRLVPAADRPSSSPAILIGSVKVAGRTFLASDLGRIDVPRFELGPALNHLQFEFFTLGSGPADGTRYQYRLEGADRAWNGPTERRDITYASLSPGRYRFVVRTVSTDGTSSRIPASVEFTILPPVWQRWWFRAGAVLGVMLLVVAAHRYRVTRLLALERIRMRIAADLHDDIGGSLSRISIQSEVVCREIAAAGGQPARRVADIAESARDVVDALGDVVWSVDPRKDDLASVLGRIRGYGDDLFGGSAVHWAYSAAGNLADVRLEPQARRDLFLLLKEAVTNIARHASARAVSLDVELTKHHLRALLRDDGCGFAPDMPEGHGDRHGLASMRARADRLGATLTVASTSGIGTSVLLHMPIRDRRRMTMLLPARLR